MIKSLELLFLYHKIDNDINNLMKEIYFRLTNISLRFFENNWSKKKRKILFKVIIYLYNISINTLNSFFYISDVCF